jgi:hypothetical protein
MGEELSKERRIGGRRMRAAVWVLAIFLILFVGCKSSSGGSDDAADDSPTVPVAPDEPIVPAGTICVGGYAYDASFNSGEYISCYWKNGTQVLVRAGWQASAICLDGGKVYMAVEGSSGFFLAAAYCIDTASHVLRGVWDDTLSGEYDYTVKGIAVSGGTICVSGYCTTRGRGTDACYWLGDGTRVELPGGNSTANGIVVKGGAVYAAGYYSGNTACFWVDGVKTDLNGYAASALAVDSGTVYTAGSYLDGARRVPCYWIGTSRTELPGDGTNDANATGIAVSRGAVYTVGYYNDGSIDKACIWKGTARTDLPGDGTHESQALGIAAYGGTVYAAGYYNDGSVNRACYWTGSTRTDLPADSDHRSMATSIAVGP